MPKGQQGSHQQNNQNKAQAQHDDENSAQGQAQLDHQNNHIGRPNAAELPTLNQQIRTHMQLQENILYTISDRLDKIDESISKNTQNERQSSIRRIEESLGINQDRELSNSKKFIEKHLTELNPGQISIFFQKFLDQNKDLGISVTQNERRDKKLLLHKIDIYWDIIEPHLLAKCPTIIDEILHPRQ